MTNAKLQTYHDLLLKWQKTMNLVSRQTLDTAWERHFEDSLQLLPYIPKGAKTLCDIGSGAGFPGLVIAIENPDLQVHLVESDMRKCQFLRNVSRETLAANVTIHNERIEDILPDLRADVLTSRALASLKQLICYAKPLWEANSNLLMILPKGQNWQEEVEDARGKFTFDLTDSQSTTDRQGRILLVHNIGQK